MNDRQIFALARAHRVGSVRNRDLRLKFGISTEAARLDLAALVRQGLLVRRGRNSGTCYVTGEMNARSRVVVSVLNASRGDLAAIEHFLGALARG